MSTNCRVGISIPCLLYSMCQCPGLLCSYTCIDIDEEAVLAAVNEITLYSGNVGLQEVRV